MISSTGAQPKLDFLQPWRFCFRYCQIDPNCLSQKEFSGTQGFIKRIPNRIPHSHFWNSNSDSIPLFEPISPSVRNEDLLLILLKFRLFQNFPTGLP